MATSYGYNEELVAAGLVLLSSVDESADYEVDEAHIFYDPEKRMFLLRTASGCSCWDGEYIEEWFASLMDLRASLVRDDRTYNPSLTGAMELLDGAEAAMARLAPAPRPS